MNTFGPTRADISLLAVNLKKKRKKKEIFKKKRLQSAYVFSYFFNFFVFCFLFVCLFVFIKKCFNNVYLLNSSYIASNIYFVPLQRIQPLYIYWHSNIQASYSLGHFIHSITKYCKRKKAVRLNVSCTRNQ